MQRTTLSLAVLFAVGSVPPMTFADDSVESVIAQPQQVKLTGSRDRQRLVIQARLADGSTRDVTEEATVRLANDAIAKVQVGVVDPLANGQTKLTIEYAGKACSVPVTVDRVGEDQRPRFRNDVLPILTKSGCNTGKCHGAASGKDGFRLSLFGYDPPGDHYRLTREMSGRRINLGAPEESLVVTKATGLVPHTGGTRIETDSNQYEVLLSWLYSGADADPLDTPSPVRIEVHPQQVVFPTRGGIQRTIVTAYYSDGAQRDVTDLAVFISNNEAAATVTEDGVMTSTGPGSAFILARFDQFTEGAFVTVRPGTPYQPGEFESQNFIDEIASARWRDMHIVPSELCSDEVFLRRVYIDLIGLLPTPEQHKAFLDDPSPNKRDEVVDALIARDEFRDQWVMQWAEMLQIRTSNGVSPKGLQLYDKWLRERVHAGTTIDKIVRELIPATGGTFENPATSYYQTETTPQLLAEGAAQAFLGTRIQCAQCHNHPFDRWTMDDYYGFAEFFAQVGYKQAQDPREITIFNGGAGTLKHPVPGRTISLKYLGGNLPELKPGDDYRAALADWLASEQNTAFSRNLANVVWSHFFGIGIVEPVDDMRVSNPPSNPALLDALGEKLAEDHFDIAPLVRAICTSRTYQLATQRNSSNTWDERNFSHGRVRRMRAEILLDCINQVTEAAERFPGLPAGSRAVQIADGQTPNYFLTTFGRSSRATACTCEVKTSPTLSQALHLLNGESTSGKIEEGQVITRLMSERQDPTAVVADLYERCLSRQPTAEEVSAIQKKLSESGDVSVALVDLFWALLNSNEFVFNH
jgi:hypothetical protein